MSIITGTLDAFAAQLQALFPTTRVTRDPAKVLPPCFHIGLPAVVGSTLRGPWSMDVPVYAVGTAPGDQSGMDPVMDMIEGTRPVLGRVDWAAVTLATSEETSYPAYRATARIHSKEA